MDCCEDLAQVYFGRGDLGNTEIWLRRGEDTIPPEYKIAEGTGLQPIAIEECVEEFWQLMGKIELLRGHMEYERGVRRAREDITSSGRADDAALRLRR